MLDQAVRFGLDAGYRIGDVALLVERKLGLDRLDRQRGTAGAARLVTGGLNLARGD